MARAPLSSHGSPPRWRAGRIALAVLTLAGAAAVSQPQAAAVEHLPTAAIIDNGVVQLGIHPEGHLNVEGGPPSSGEGTTIVGLRYLPTGAESTAPGCTCEGWGAADATSGVSGFANDNDGVQNLTVVDFQVTASEAISTVEVTPAAGGDSVLRVTHDYHPATTPNLYEATVTIENVSDAPVEPRYRRVMDWDIEPTPFAEVVTIDGAVPPNLLFSSNDGFASADPLSGPSDIGFTGPPSGAFFVDEGPDDHGALFDFGFDTLAPGGQVQFNIYYGAAGNENDALLAVDFVGASIYSLGQASTPDGPSLGTPNTFIFAFGAVGGEPAPRLSVRKRADDPITEAGGTNGYTIALTNPLAVGAVVTDVTDLLPPGFHYVTGSSTFDGAAVVDPTVTPDAAGDTLVWNGPFSVASRTRGNLHFIVSVDEAVAAGSYRNAASATAVTDEAEPKAIITRSTGPVAPVEVPAPTVATDVTATAPTGSVTTDPTTGRLTVSMARGARSDVTVAAAVACPEGSSLTAVELRHGGTGYPMLEDPEGSGSYVGVIPASGLTDGPIEVAVTCGGTTIVNTVGTVALFDPSGVITDAATGAPIPGATVTLYKKPFALPDGGGEVRDCRTLETRPGSNWDGVAPGDLTTAEEGDPSLQPAEMSPLINPQTTGADGRYGWNVATGCWFVVAEASGYTTKVSALVGVPPEVTDLDLALTSVGGGGGGGGGGGTSPTTTPTTAPTTPPTTAPPEQPSTSGARAIDDSCAATAVPASSFEDVPSSNVHAHAIACAAWWDVAEGFTAARFGPREHVTRAQMASFIARLITVSGGQLPEAAADRFSDDDASVHHDNINRLAAMGVISGRGDGTFGPDVPVTRGQTASFIVRAFELRTETTLAWGNGVFQDVQGSPHIVAIDKAAMAGFTAGTTQSTFSPAQTVARDQMASFMVRVLDLLVEEGFSSPPAA